MKKSILILFLYFIITIMVGLGVLYIFENKEILIYRLLFSNIKKQNNIMSEGFILLQRQLHILDKDLSEMELKTYKEIYDLSESENVFLVIRLKNLNNLYVWGTIKYSLNSTFNIEIVNSIDVSLNANMKNWKYYIFPIDRFRFFIRDEIIKKQIPIIKLKWMDLYAK